MASACVTGAGGFIGAHLFRRLGRDGWRVATPRVRVDAAHPFSPEPGDVVFHLAGIAHRRSQGLASCMAANCALATDLYTRAARAGAAGFVYLSSSKVLGDSSRGVPLREDAPRRPVGAYACSKAAAEAELLGRHRRLGLPLYIIRPPLTYGPGAKANFLILLNALAQGWPLPLAAARGLRSWVSVNNLADALAAIGAKVSALPSVATWHVADAEDVDLPTLCRRVSAKLGRPSRLWRVPRAAFQATARISGNCGVSTNLVASIFDDFRLDTTALRTALDWSPPQSMDAALDEVVRWFVRTREHGSPSPVDPPV